MEGKAFENMNRPALILRYASISSKELLVTDEKTLKDIQEEKDVIENSLGMSKEEIIVEAAKLVTSDLN